MKPGVIALISLFCVFDPSAPAQAIKGRLPAGRTGVPYDWSHRHLVFSEPASPVTLGAIEQDSRFWQQVNRKFYAGRMRNPAPSASAFKHRPERPAPAKFDWSESLGTLDFANLVNYPAKYSFDVANPFPDCVNDYVVYTLPTANPSAFNLIAFNNLYVNNEGTANCLGTTPSVLFKLQRFTK